MAKLELTSTKL